MNKKREGNEKRAISPLTGAPTPAGRPPGRRNKITRLAKDNINAVYEGLGSIEGHIKFLRIHPKALQDFYSNVYPRLLPLDVQHGGDLTGAFDVCVKTIITQDKPTE
jgi:hypothetical protein